MAHGACKQRRDLFARLRRQARHGHGPARLHAVPADAGGRLLLSTRPIPPSFREAKALSVQNSIQTYSGIDFGTRKIGVAVGQTLTRTAMGIAVVPVHANVVDWDMLDKLVQQWKPGAFVVGMPFSMDGTDNNM